MPVSIGRPGGRVFWELWKIHEVCSSASPPGQNSKPLESAEVSIVECHESQSVDVSDRSNLSLGERRRFALCCQPRAFLCMPLRRRSVVIHLLPVRGEKARAAHHSESLLPSAEGRRCRRRMRVLSSAYDIN